MNAAALKNTTVWQKAKDQAGHEHDPATGQFGSGGGGGGGQESAPKGGDMDPADKARSVASRAAVKEQIGEAGHPEGAEAMRLAQDLDPQLAEVGKLAQEAQHAQRYSSRHDTEVVYDPDRDTLTVWEGAGKKIHLETDEKGRGIRVSGNRGSKIIPPDTPADEATYVIHRVAGLRVPKALAEKFGEKYGKKPKPGFVAARGAEDFGRKPANNLPR